MATEWTFTIEQSPTDEKVHVRAVFTDPRGMVDPTIILNNGFGGVGWDKYVGQPNWLQRIFGVTFHDKIRMAQDGVKGAANYETMERNRTTFASAPMKHSFVFVGRRRRPGSYNPAPLCFVCDMGRNNGDHFPPPPPLL